MCTQRQLPEPTTHRHPANGSLRLGAAKLHFFWLEPRQHFLSTENAVTQSYSWVNFDDSWCVVTAVTAAIRPAGFRPNRVSPSTYGRWHQDALQNQHLALLELGQHQVTSAIENMRHNLSKTCYPRPDTLTRAHMNCTLHSFRDQ